MKVRTLVIATSIALTTACSSFDDEQAVVRAIEVAITSVRTFIDRLSPGVVKPGL